MKKFYSILAAALISVCAFASKDVVPSDAILADYYDQGQVCVCFFVPADMACNDIVLTGSFNGWKSSAAECIQCEAVEGYDGWYVGAFEPEDEPDAEKGIQAKPIILDVDGNFSWEYQVGAATAIRGGVQVVQGAYAGEIDMINYGNDAPNVFTVDAWKQNPCTAIYHNYTITVVSAGCDGKVVPFLVGAMNSWTFTQMQVDLAKTEANDWVPTYTISFKAAEETPFQIVSGVMDDEGEISVQPSWTDDAYMQVLVDGEWVRYNPDNSFTGAEANIVYDLRVDTMRWARCDDTPAEYVVLALNLPTENCPNAVEIIGTFDGWQGTAMEHLDNGWWFVELEAKPSDFFKIRGAGSWDQEIEIYNAEDDVWSKIADEQFKFGDLWQDDSWKGVACKWVELDWSDPDIYRWKSNMYDVYLSGITYGYIGNYGYIYGDWSGTVPANTYVYIECDPSCGTFDHWSDGVTSYYREFYVSQDVTISAIISGDETYQVSVTAGEHGYLSNGYVGERSSCDGSLYVEAYADEGYHFVGWSDGYESYSRTIYFSSDTTIYAMFEEDIYYNVSLSGITYAYISNYGYIYSDWSGNLLENTYIEMECYPDCGTFEGWSDGVTNNYRSFYLTQDTTISATISGREVYQVSITAGEHGSVYNAYVGERMACEGVLYVVANADEGYRFYQWSDGVTNNARDIYFTQDTTITAIFAQIYQNIQIGDLYYELTVDYNTAVVLGLSDSDETINRELVIPSSVSYNGVNYEVISINSGAFANHTELTSVEIPTTMTNIAYYAFEGCNNITSVVWNARECNNCYFGSQVESFVFGDEVESIPYELCYNMYKLASITIPSSVTYIGSRAFAYCNGLTSVEIPNNVIDAGYDVFYRCDNLISYKGPAVLCSGMYYLQKAIITGGTIEFNYGGVGYNYNMTYLDVAACDNTILPSNVFNGNYNLKQLILPKNLKSIEYMAVAECMNLEEITIPATVETIGDRAFEDCRSLKSVTFAGTALTTIGDWAFYNCHELKNLVIPEGVTTIGKAAFYGCAYLNQVTLPASVKAMGDNAFALCSMMQKLYVNAVVPPTIEDKTFEQVSLDMPVYVPDESISAYKADKYWGRMNIIGAETAVGNISSDAAAIRKQMINGQLFIILPDGSRYSATGVKVE